MLTEECLLSQHLCRRWRRYVLYKKYIIFYDSPRGVGESSSCLRGWVVRVVEHNRRTDSRTRPFSESIRYVRAGGGRCVIFSHCSWNKINECAIGRLPGRAIVRQSSRHTPTTSRAVNETGTLSTDDDQELSDLAMRIDRWLCFGESIAVNEWWNFALMHGVYVLLFASPPLCWWLLHLWNYRLICSCYARSSLEENSAALMKLTLVLQKH